MLDVACPRDLVWRALALLEPYCAVCDVTCIPTGSSRGPTHSFGLGSTFACYPGRDVGGRPRDGAAQGEVIAWEPGRLVATRLELTPEIWTTRIEFVDGEAPGTRVTITVTRRPTAGGWLLQRLQGRASRRLVQTTLDWTLDKVPDHVRQATPSPPDADEGPRST